MDPAEREKVLATRTPWQREVLQGKLREYESLTPAERESRLCTLGLRLYLRPLMEVPLARRAERLAAVPQPERKVVEDRLRLWDQLTPAVQKEFLTNEWVLRFIFRPETGAPNQAGNMAPYVKKKIDEAIDGWNVLSQQKRQEIIENFKTLFEVSSREKARILEEFSAVERQRMQKTLETFERLPKEQRERCVNGFQKFAGLTLEQREQFLGNVERWERMSAQDRLAWRVLVNRMSVPKPPPTPAGANNPPPPPPFYRPTPPPEVASTNR
jgi:hypothetical protein